MDALTLLAARAAVLRGHLKVANIWESGDLMTGGSGAAHPALGESYIQERYIPKVRDSNPVTGLLAEYHGKSPATSPPSLWAGHAPGGAGRLDWLRNAFKGRGARAGAVGALGLGSLAGGYGLYRALRGGQAPPTPTPTPPVAPPTPASSRIAMRQGLLQRAKQSLGNLAGRFTRRHGVQE